MAELWKEPFTQVKSFLKIPSTLGRQVFIFKGSSSFIFDRILQSKVDIWIVIWQDDIIYFPSLFHHDEYDHSMSRVMTTIYCDSLCFTIKKLIENKCFDFVSHFINDHSWTDWIWKLQTISINTDNLPAHLKMILT